MDVALPLKHIYQAETNGKKSWLDISAVVNKNKSGVLQRKCHECKLSLPSVLKQMPSRWAYDWGVNCVNPSGESSQQDGCDDTQHQPAACSQRLQPNINSKRFSHPVCLRQNPNHWHFISQRSKHISCCLACNTQTLQTQARPTGLTALFIINRTHQPLQIILMISAVSCQHTHTHTHFFLVTPYSEG